MPKAGPEGWVRGVFRSDLSLSCGAGRFALRAVPRYRGAEATAAWKRSGGFRAERSSTSSRSSFFPEGRSPGPVGKIAGHALDNHPDLETFIVTLPFDPTPTIKARRGQGEAEKLETWRQSLVARAARRGATIEVVWWCSSELKSRLLGMDNPQGRILYWFGTSHLSQESLSAAVRVSDGIAGPRYSPTFRLGTDAGDTLKAFGLDPDWAATKAGWTARLESAVEIWTSKSPKDDKMPSPIPATHQCFPEDAPPNGSEIISYRERPRPVASRTLMQPAA